MSTCFRNLQTYNKERDTEMNDTNEAVLPLSPYKGSLAKVKEFDERHGKNSIIVAGYRTYEDGAQRDADMAIGPLIEPPEDDFERLTLRFKYWEELVTRAVKLFEQTKHDYLAAAKGRSVLGNPPPDEIEAVARLEEIKTLVEARRERLAPIRAQLEATEEFQRRKRAREMDAENRGRADDFMETVRGLQV